MAGRLRLMVIALMPALAGGWLVSCGQIGSSPPTSKPVSPRAVVSTTAATIGPIAQTISYAGVITPLQQVNLVPKVAGVITRIAVQPGATVTQGQLVAQLDDSTQKAGLQQAQAALAAAQANLQKLEEGPTATVIAMAKANEVSAATSLANAQRTLDAAIHTAGADAQASTQAIANAQAAEQQDQRVLALLQSSQPADVAQSPTLTAVANAKAALAAIQSPSSPQAATLQQAQIAYANAQHNLTATQATEQITLAADQQNIAKAQDALYAAQTTRDGICGDSKNPTYMCQSANASVDAAQTALNQATLQYKEAQQQAQQTLATAQGQLATALAGVKTAQAAYNQAVSAAQKALATAQAAQAAAIQTAQQNLTTAENQLKAAQASANATQAKDAAAVTQAANAVQTAEAQLHSAQAAYANTIAPPTPAELAAAKAQVQTAQAQLVTAQTALDQTEIKAPFAGIIAQVPLQVGALATPTQPVATLVSRAVQVQVNVEETNAALIAVGQPVTLTVSDYPGVSFPARVTQIAPVANSTSHVFAAVITPQPADPRLKPGMSTTATITVQQIARATLVPRVAVITSNGQNVVYTVKNGRAQAVPVKVGLTTPTEAQIVQGVIPGEPVVTLGQTSLITNEPVHVQTSPGLNATPGPATSGKKKLKPTSASTIHQRRSSTKKSPTATPTAQAVVPEHHGASPWA